MKILASVIAVLFLFAGATIFAARFGALDADPAESRARYGGPTSKFVEIDGTRIHYRDEGQGRVLVLLHGSRGNLQQWDGWVQQLGGRFRIVRFDALAHGLTVAGDHNDFGAERQLFLMQEFFARLKLDRFVLGGTSSGATLAVRYAAEHPERVEKLVLSTVPLRLPAQARTSAVDRAIFWTHDKLLGSESTEIFWRTFLRSIVGNPQVVTPELVQRYRLLNTQPGQREHFRQRIAAWRASGGPERDFALAARITVPTLIQWGGAGPVLPKDMFCEIAAAFTATESRVIIYPELGHLLDLEDPEHTARDALAFIDGSAVGQRCDTSDASAAGAAARNAASVPASSR